MTTPTAPGSRAALFERIARVAGAAPREADVFVKTHSGEPRGMYAAEVAGLEQLRAALASSGTTVRTPRVIATAEEEDAGPAFLALERVVPGRPTRASAEELGRGLAAVHRVTHPSFGGAHDSATEPPNVADPLRGSTNFIATLPQSNRAHDTWASFYRNERLAPLVTRARGLRLLSSAHARSFDALYARLGDLVGPIEPPSLVHGDLWGGNALVDTRGVPVLIDPSVYFGHREMDLAMMRLFGGFDPATLDAYAEAFPLAEGHADRVHLHQLYPLLVHVNLFGAGYVTQLERALAAALARR